MTVVGTICRLGPPKAKSLVEEDMRFLLMMHTCEMNREKKERAEGEVKPQMR